MPVYLPVAPPPEVAEAILVVSPATGPPRGSSSIRRPLGMGGFKFAVLSTLRAKQLIRGCTPRVDGNHKLTVLAQFEVADGKVKEDMDASANAAASSRASAAIPSIFVSADVRRDVPETATRASR